MDNYLVCDKSKITGSIFQYKDEYGKNVNFYYTSYNDCFTMFVEGLPVCFRFKDIKLSREVEVFTPSEYKYEFDYELLFNRLKQLIIEYPLVQYVKEAFPLDNTKIEFIKNNCEALSIVETEDEDLLLDVKLPSIKKTGDKELSGFSSKLSTEDINLFEEKSKSLPKDDNSKYYSMYNQLIVNLQNSFSSSGLSVLIGSTISKNEGLQFYIVNNIFEADKSSIANLHLNDKGECKISNLYLTGSLVPLGSTIIKNLERLQELDFINSIIYDPSIDNKVYNNLNRLGYCTETGILVPKSPMVKVFNQR